MSSKERIQEMYFRYATQMRTKYEIFLNVIWMLESDRKTAYQFENK